MRNRLVVQPQPTAATMGWCNFCAANLQETAESMPSFAMQVPQCWMPHLSSMR